MVVGDPEAVGSDTRSSEDWLNGVAASVLRAAVRAGELLMLELRVTGSPELSAREQGEHSASGGQLILWYTHVEPNAWHEGLRLVATAHADSPPARGAVRDAAIVLNELLVADRRRARAEQIAERAVDIAGRDPLTKVGNRRTWRRALDDEAARASRYGHDTTVAVVDLDELKRVNDTQGHAAGDVLLQRASAAIRAACRSVDIICRLGGDEFGVLAAETGAEGATRLVSRLRQELDTAHVQASIGASTSQSGDLDESWHRADAEMYQEKRSRRRE